MKSVLGNTKGKQICHYVPDYVLYDLADYYGISTQGAHRALADCRMNQKVFELLAKEMEAAGTLKSKPGIKLCPGCGLPMQKRNGRFGEFWGCTGFPDCRCTENI